LSIAFIKIVVNKISKIKMSLFEICVYSLSTFIMFILKLVSLTYQKAFNIAMLYFFLSNFGLWQILYDFILVLGIDSEYKNE